MIINIYELLKEKDLCNYYSINSNPDFTES